MTALLIHVHLRTIILILSGMINLHPALASDELSLPSRVSAMRMSVASYERIPINTLLARPVRYARKSGRLHPMI